MSEMRLAPAVTVADAVREVRDRISAACDRVGREPREVTLLGVTKTVDPDRIRDALDAGLSHLGENRVQETVPKMKALSDRAPTWHFIGHLQTNKAARAAELFDRIESVDSLKLARVLEAAAEETGRELRVFAQVKIGTEPGKHGISVAELEEFVDEVNALPRLCVVGLMSIPPRRESLDDTRRDFASLRDAYERLRQGRPELRHLSMGMSGDFEIAIEEGATEVRVGTALFGAR